MGLPARILLVDDEATIRLTLGILLKRNGYAISFAESGEAALRLIDEQEFDLLVVDLNMPGIGGMEVVAAARMYQPDLAIIVLTGHSSVDTAIEGLHQGIFDYVLKTSSPEEVQERVHAALAQRAHYQRQQLLLDAVGAAVQELRSDSSPHSMPEPTSGPVARIVRVGELEIDPWRQLATLEGRVLALTPTEFRLLLCMAERVGTVLSFAELVQCAQGYATDPWEASELVKPHIHHLRHKIEPDPSAPRYILTVRGKGYLLVGNGEGSERSG
jgi:DNA-binding response OmpR family regulator